MAKKWIAVMLVVCIGLAGGVVYLRTESDHKGPEIVCSDQAVTEYDPSMSDADLTQGITASDNVDGDVTDTLTVESVYEVMIPTWLSPMWQRINLIILPSLREI